MVLVIRMMDDVDHGIRYPFYHGFLGLSPELVHTHCHQPKPKFFCAKRHPSCKVKPQESAKSESRQVVPGGKEDFEVSMDVSEFRPSEMNVKMVGNSIVIEGKQEEREDNDGFISRHFVKRYMLPKEFDAEKVNTSLSSEGVLTIRASKLQPMKEQSKERVVQIQQTGLPHSSRKDSAVEEGSTKLEQKRNDRPADDNGEETEKEKN